MEYTLRFGKAVVITAIMFVSLRYLGFSLASSAVFSLVPLLLGSLNVLTSVAYSLTAAVLILASSTALLPNWRTHVSELVVLLAGQEAGVSPKTVVVPAEQVKSVATERATPSASALSDKHDSSSPR